MWTNPTYPTDDQGYNLLSKWDEPPSTYICIYIYHMYMYICICICICMSHFQDFSEPQHPGADGRAIADARGLRDPRSGGPA